MSHVACRRCLPIRNEGGVAELQGAVRTILDPELRVYVCGYVCIERIDRAKVIKLGSRSGEVP